MSVHSSDKEYADVQVGEVKFLKVEDVDYIEEKGGNGGGASYQIATGAPIEVHNPLGYRVGFWTALMLNVGQTIGTGIFSTPSNILSGTGSVGMALIYWVIGLIVTLAGVSVYLELASFFPSRSGAEVVYLEQAFNRPKYFFPITFAVYSVLLSFNSSNSIVLAQYIFRVAARKGSEWEQKGVAIAGVTIVCIGKLLPPPQLTQSSSSTPTSRSSSSTSRAASRSSPSFSSRSPALWSSAVTRPWPTPRPTSTTRSRARRATRTASQTRS
jgi:hypothetical protein